MIFQTGFFISQEVRQSVAASRDLARCPVYFGSAITSLRVADASKLTGAITVMPFP
jgi:hypothetical protein